jgi:diacylglycerol kinase family enzyme
VRFLVIVNTRSGSGATGLFEFVKSLGLTGAEVVMRFASADHPLEHLARDAVNFDRVVAVGGDGTFSTVCYTTRDTGIPVLAYPAGTANLLTLNLGLPMDALGLADIALNGVPASFDLGELVQMDADGQAAHTGFVMAAGAGFDATIMQAAQPLKSTLGAAAYLMAAVSNLTPTVSEFELVLDGRHIHTDGIAVLLVNFGRIQFDLAVTRGWDPRDGRLDVVVLRTRNVAGLLPVVFAAMLEKVADLPDKTPSVDVYTAAEVELSAYPPLAMQYDGEALPTLTPCAARVLPGAATLLVPPDSPYSEQKTASIGGSA